MTGLPDLAGHDWPEFPPGLVWLAGAGPGAPGLLTLEALQRGEPVGAAILNPEAAKDFAWDAHRPEPSDEEFEALVARSAPSFSDVAGKS